LFGIKVINRFWLLEHPGRNLLSRSELHPRATEEQMTRHPIFLEENKKPPKPEANEPAKDIEETARSASSVEATGDSGRVRRSELTTITELD
jgi:hypothetical protein